MNRLDELAERIERLLLRHEEQKRTNQLLVQQVQQLSAERDSLRSRLAAARARTEALLDRLPAEGDGLPTPVAPALLGDPPQAEPTP